MNSFSTDSFKFIDFTEMNGTLTRKVWECRNLPEIRKWMVNPDFIPYENHVRFIKGLKEKSNVAYYVVLWNGEFIGSVNIHIEGKGVAERGIYVHPDYWGKGFAKKICRALYAYLSKNKGINTIVTKVLKSNVSSKSLERSLGASEMSEDRRFVFYACDISNH